MSIESATDRDCVFCEIVAGRISVDIRTVHDGGMIFTPTNPVVKGHVLVIPNEHVEDFAQSPRVTAEVMARAARYARNLEGDWNLITSKGVAATQSVFHLHVHLVPRHGGDGLTLPWTGQKH